MFFPDPDKPIITCISESCDDCNVSHAVQCHFRPKDLIHFLCIVLPSFLLGGAGIYNLSGSLLVFWILMIVGYFGFVEIRIMCSHCPHYAEKCSSLKCWANYGSPKIWKYRPGPMSFMEKAIFLGGFTIIWGYPFPFLLAGMQWFLLLVYIFVVVQCRKAASPLQPPVIYLLSHWHWLAGQSGGPCV